MGILCSRGKAVSTSTLYALLPIPPSPFVTHLPTKPNPRLDHQMALALLDEHEEDKNAQPCVCSSAGRGGGVAEDVGRE